MKLVQHPNVVRLYEVIDTQTKLYLILELGDGGDLYDYIMKHEGGLSENLARHYFRQIVRAISYCHQLHVVHRYVDIFTLIFNKYPYSLYEIVVPQLLCTFEIFYINKS